MALAEASARIRLPHTNLDIFWLKDESLEDADSLPAPSILAAEIIENLEAALEQFREVALALGSEGVALGSEGVAVGSEEASSG